MVPGVGDHRSRKAGGNRAAFARWVPYPAQTGTNPKLHPLQLTVVACVVGSPGRMGPGRPR